MSKRNPKSLWDELVEAIKGWSAEEEDEEQARDPGVVYHLMYTAPIVIALLIMMRRTFA